MLKWPMGIDDTFDDIPDYDSHVDHFSLDSKDEEQADSETQLPQEYPEMPEEKIYWQEQVHMIHLRSHLNKLLETLRHAQYKADKTREELKKCRSQIEQYEEETEKLCKEIQTNENEGNKPAVTRLQSALKRVCSELETEQKLESMIRDQLEQAEYELALAEVERGKFILAEDNLLQKEQQLSNEKAEMAMIRLQKEQLSARNAVASKEKNKRKIQDSLNDAEKRHIQAIKEAERSHERANKYLSKTLAKLKKQQLEEQDRYNADMARKIDMVLKLKNDITSNRENLRVIWARDTATERQKNLAEKEEMNKIHSEGGNAEEILLIKKRKNEVEKKKQQFEAEQKLKRAAIVGKILKEEESFKRRMEQQPYLWTDPGQEKALRLHPVKRKQPKLLVDYISTCADKGVEDEKVDDGKQKKVQQVDVESSDSYFVSDEYRKTLKKLSLEMKKQVQLKEMKSLISLMMEADQNKNKINIEDEEMGNEILADINSEEEMEFLDDEEVTEEGEEEEEEHEHTDASEESSVHKDMTLSEVEEEEEIQGDLAKPEFEGLWNKETTAYKPYKDTDSFPAKPIGGSKMEQEILKKTLDKTREGIIITQVAAGREFSGRPFYSKPNIIHFKDIVIGKSYKKKVTLTNVSYTLNYIKFMDVSDNLKNFMKISFEPPGQMSAGMTCEMTVTFKPEINEDLKGEVCFLTQTGPFQIPLICSTKKCDLILNTRKIDFGTSVIGETLKQSFVLTNRGALGTKFSFFKVTGIKPETPVAETGFKEQFSEFLELNESQENVLEDIQSIILSNRQEKLTSQDLFPDDVNYVNEITPEMPSELKSETGPTTPFEDAEVRITSSAKLAEQFVDQEQNSGSSKSLEGELEIITSTAVADQDGVEAFSETKVEITSSEMDRVPEEAVSLPSIIPTEAEDISSLDGLKVGPVFAGNIGHFSSVRLEIIWQPTIPGEVKSQFVVAFADPQIEPLTVCIVANAIDVPVWMERQTVDLKICMFDRLYQDTVIINNRATIAQRLQFEVCKELRNHLELLPKTCYIQAHSQFSAQLKFLPRQSLFKEAAKFFDTETGVLEAPMTVRVGNQVTPVYFTVQAVVTTSDLEFDVSGIDFGCCTVHESVKQTFKLTNKSILPQQYGFVGLPECLEVQPNDGFGYLLPLETLELDVIFSPKAAKDYKMNLLVRSLINRDFSIPCEGVGVLTPLALSQQVIHFCATPLYDTSSCAILVVNNHTSTNEFSHPVPRIGKGEVCPVGPTSFEFKVPEDAPITISPSVGTVLPGQKLRVEVLFSPTLNNDDIRLETLKILIRLEEEREEKEREEAARKEEQESLLQETVVEPKLKKGAKPMNANVNNLKGEVNMAQDAQGENVNHSKFGDYKKFEGKARDVKTLNTSENRSQQNDDMIVTSETILNQIWDISDTDRTVTGTSKISVKTFSSKCSTASEKCAPHITRMKHKALLRNMHDSSLPRHNPHNERTGNSVNRNVNRMINSRQEEKNIRKVSQDVPESINRKSVRKSINASQYNAMKLQDRKHANTSNKMEIKIHKMNSNSSAYVDEDKNNNMVEDTDDIENKQALPGKRSNEEFADLTAVDKWGSKEINNGLPTSYTQDGDDIDNDQPASVGKKKSSSSPKLTVSRSKSKISSAQSLQPSAPGLMSKSDLGVISSDSQEHRSAVSSLMRQFKGHFQSVTVPCYVASGTADSPGELNYSIHNTLYLEVHCPSVRPPVIIISDDGRRAVDFGSVSVGQTCSKWVTLMNISEKEINLRATALKPAGIFQIQNALRAMSPGATHTLLLTFTPNQDNVFQENFGIKTHNSTLHLILKGCGVRPLVNLSIENDLFDMKAVLVGEFVERPFMIENVSQLAVNYAIKLDSLSHLRHDRAQMLPPFLEVQESHKSKNYVGTQNKSGRSVFDIVPATGTINAGETREIIVTFAPDHESDLYSDGVRIELFCQNCSPHEQESHFFQIIGQGKSQLMYLEGCDPLETSVKSLACSSKHLLDEESSGNQVIPQSALITVQSVIKGDSFEPGVRNIFIGCIRTMVPNQKKSGDFSVDGLQSLLQKGFDVQPQKGSVEADTKTVIAITWLPPPGYDQNYVVEETMSLTLKCDVTEQIPILIRAMVVSE